jgi:hypothetical protein
MVCAYRASHCERDADRKKRDGDGGRFLYTPEGCNEIVRTLTLSHPESIVDVVARAESLMETGAGDAGADPGASFVLARAYRYCGYRRFLDRLESITARNLDGDGRVRASADQDVIDGAAHVFSDVHSWHLTADSRHPVEDALRAAVDTRCSRLVRVPRRSAPLARAMAAGAVSMAALGLPGIRSASQRREWGLSMLSDLTREYVYPTRPVSLGERTLVAQLYLSLLVLSQRHEIEAPAHVLGCLEFVIDSIAGTPEDRAQREPSGRVLNIVPFEPGNARKAILAMGAVLFDRPELSAGGAEASETVLWTLGVDGLEEYEALFATEAVELV